MFKAMSEIMLDLYGDTTRLKLHDPLLLQKWRNLIPTLEKGSKEIHTLYSEEEIKVFYHLTNALEYLVTCTESPAKMFEISELILAHKKNDITIINTREELLRVVNGEEVVNG
jgi:hypothetical protein